MFHWLVNHVAPGLGSRWRRATARSRRTGAVESGRSSGEPLETRLLPSGNLPPVNGVPASQSTNQNLALTFSEAGGNRISISDADGSLGPYRVTLAATHGVVSLVNADDGPALTFLQGDGQSDEVLQFAGTLDDINRALEWVVFVPEAGYVGDDAALEVTSDDQAPEGPATDTDVVQVRVKPTPGNSQVFNVRDFGALGDGVADDAAAIRAAIAAATSSGGGTILFPPGRYSIQSFDPRGTLAACFHLVNVSGLKFSGYGASLECASQMSAYLFYLNGARGIEFEGFAVDGQFSRTNNRITHASIGVFYVASTDRDSDGLRFVDIQATDAYYFLMCFSSLTAPWRARNLDLENCQLKNGYYGLSFQNNGDNVRVRNFQSSGLVRSYFPYGVDCHDIEYTSVGGDTFTDCLIKAYQRDTTNLHVKVRVIGNTSQDAKCTLESQHNPRLQPTPARLRNIRVDFNDQESEGPKSLRFAYFQDTPAATPTASSLTNLFDNVVVSGTARNATDFAVRQEVSGRIELTRLLVVPSRIELSSNSILENQAPGVVIATLSTVDDNPGDGFTYELVGGTGSADNGLFALDGDQLRTATTFDFEARRRYSIRLRTTDSSGLSRDQEVTIEVRDEDEFDVGPTADADATENAVWEGAAFGVAVGITVAAVDRDGSNNLVTYSLLDSAGGRFRIHPTSGVVSVAEGAILDREQAASYQIVVQAQGSDGSSSSSPFTIALKDVDEFDTGPVLDTDAAPDAVLENAAVGTRVGITATASDADATNSQVTYSLASNAAGRFAIDPISGVITVANSSLLDREHVATWSVSVVATSQDGSRSSRSYTIALVDVNEYSISNVFDFDSSINMVAENAAAGTAVGIRGYAVDLDATGNEVRYSLTGDAGGRFTIDAATGIVRVADGQKLDREQAANWNVTVRATSQDGSFNERAFSINVSDIDEFDVTAPVDADGAPNQIRENAQAGTPVGLRAAAIDADATQNLVTYSLVDSAGGRFVINASTGVVTVAPGAVIDREAASAHSITVRATSADGSTAISSWTIAVLDVNEFSIGPITEINPDANVVTENAAPGTRVGVQVRAVDLDAVNNTVTYRLTNDSDSRFVIHPTTGVVTVANGALLDYERQQSHVITVQAASSDGSTTTLALTIQVLNTFDAPRIEISSDAVDENLPAGTAVATISTEDVQVDSPVYSLVSGEGGSDNSRFTISGNQLVARSPFNFEAKARYYVRIQMRDAAGVTMQRVVMLNVRDINEPRPPSHSLSDTPGRMSSGNLWAF